MPSDPPREELLAQLARLQQERDELTRSLPAHSTPPTLLIRLEDLDEAIAALRLQIDRSSAGPADDGR
jgi:hypothetical protein